MTKIILIYVCLIMINILASGAGAQSQINGKWKLTGYDFTPKQKFPIEKMTIDLTITDSNRIGGNSGCNIFGGNIMLGPGRKIKVGPMTSTERFCDEMTGQFESLFINTLQNATTYSLKKDVLTITETGKKSFLRFERLTEPPKKKMAAEEKQKSVFVSEPLVKK